jgi:uncharacterized protein (TIGR02598 family)
MKSSRRQAFSLVEIVLAIGIISFGCIAIFGLLGVTANASRLSSDETAIATMSRHVISSIKQQTFPAIEANFMGKTTKFYFDSTGNPLTNASEAFYQCAVTGTEDAATTSSLSGGRTQVNLIKLQLAFTWPPSANPANTNIILTSAAR